MSMSDHEVARAVVDAESSKISYEFIDNLLGFEPNGDNAAARYNTMNRVNTILEKGIHHGEHYGAYQLVVGEKEQFYELKTLAESASLSMRSANEKATKAFDRAAQMAAYALGEKQYFRITDRRFARIVKPAPSLTEDELADLKVEYRMLRQNQSVLLALFSNAENNIENIERLMRGAKPNQRRLVKQDYQPEQAAA